MGEYQKTVVALYWTYAQITFEVLKARAHSGQMGFVSWWHFDLEGVNAYRIKGMVGIYPAPGETGKGIGSDTT
ncbi:predicted protein [Histoplasma mississippiense (nom. inval.)]|uniref:predicted protein n=1 Tax=Ajellomyces capsulatus (strain NAm1 / WU24) TaxID=2059318 RepID=UPI000157B614|nr:predicted protein [Histoplasma mississippiense (nom. inval.)]EDN03124.1 predicted protein [Histoplasma mississippiense (nom. inval.)]